ncbi:MAG: cytochrome c [Myxococcota bacterium]
MILLALACVPDPALSLDGDPEAGEALWLAECGLCHGPSGEGTPRGSPLVGVFERREPREVVEIVRFGISTMPAYEERFDDQDLADLLAWMMAGL